MRCVLKSGHLVLIPESETETTELAGWKQAAAGHVFGFAVDGGTGLALKNFGVKEVVCREPINVTSRHPDPTVRLIGNFSTAPFELDGRQYRSVESFWQGLKFDNGLERRQVAEMEGPAAQHAGAQKKYGTTVTYEQEKIPVGTWAHWQLMRQACWAKFTQNAEAAAALLSTGTRPLVHVVRHDSKTIPGVIMADIWMRIRQKLQEQRSQNGANAVSYPVPSEDEANEAETETV